MVDDNPSLYTLEFHKDKRGDRIYLDIGRNNYAQTSVAPYAVRRRPGAPVATPLRWEELDDLDLRADRYTVKSIRDRVESVGDPWKGMAGHARALGVREA
jgi:bifunctional non-homologous end joining protein LigD